LHYFYVYGKSFVTEHILQQFWRPTKTNSNRTKNTAVLFGYNNPKTILPWPNIKASNKSYLKNKCQKMDGLIKKAKKTIKA
jgi:hypothetical protein